MDYTKTYREIYKAIKSDDIDHEAAHRISNKITDAIVDLSLLIEGKDEKVAETAIDCIKKTKTKSDSFPYDMNTYYAAGK